MTRLILPLLSALLCLAVYAPGLGGGFQFDDFSALLLNPHLLPEDPASPWQWLSAAWSYPQAGPLGRPLAMFSFALGGTLHGLAPRWFIAENIALHLANGLLVWLLLRRLLDGMAPPGAARPDARVAPMLAGIIATWWMVSPMGVTGVLYIVQRMTSLAAFFCLAGLLLHLVLRQRALAGPPLRWNLLALLSLALFTALAAFSKETGLLLPVFAWLLEAFVLSRQRPFDHWSRPLRGLLWALPLLALLYGAGWLLLHPDWLWTRAASRAFSPAERLLTEGRVLFFYLGQILMPRLDAFSLYHDDIALSRGLLEPPLTLLAWAGHGLLLALIPLAYRRARPVALGLAWFYAGHLLESTVFPLEIAQEHRNYLPMLGILLATGWGFTHAIRRLPAQPVLLAAGAALLLAHAHNTWSRAELMGDAMEYALFEADSHPGSVRANFHAATLINQRIRELPAAAAELYPHSLRYLQQARAVDPEALPPYTGLLSLDAAAGRPLSSEVMDTLLHKLRHGEPPNALSNVLMAVLRIHQEHPHLLGPQRMRALFQAALDNPRLRGTRRATLLKAYGAYLLRMRGAPAEALPLVQEARRLTPDSADTALLEVEVLMQLGHGEAARRALDEAQGLDRLRRHRVHAERLAQALAPPPPPSAPR